LNLLSDFLKLSIELLEEKIKKIQTLKKIKRTIKRIKSAIF
jgi:hypothetical protein